MNSGSVVQVVSVFEMYEVPIFGKENIPIYILIRVDAVGRQALTHSSPNGVVGLLPPSAPTRTFVSFFSSVERVTARLRTFGGLGAPIRGWPYDTIGSVMRRVEKRCCSLFASFYWTQVTLERATNLP